jgi:hypothetical protein
MLNLQCSVEELKRLNHECGVMYTWLQGQGKQLCLASQIAQGTHPIVLPFSYTDQTYHKAIPLSFTRSNCMAPTSFVPARLGT